MNGRLLSKDMASVLASIDEADYRASVPFPHRVIDNFILPWEATQLADSFPPAGLSCWKRHRHANSDKLACNTVLDTPGGVLEALSAMNSLAVVRQVSRLVGEEVRADPFLEGGGMHLILKGGFLGIHADFNVHPNGEWVRAANLLVYLNEAEGGDLELWRQDGSGVAKIVPIVPGRAVLFTTSDGALHGHPHPLVSPNRKSLATYYYVQRPAGVVPHTTIYKGGGKHGNTKHA